MEDLLDTAKLSSFYPRYVQVKRKKPFLLRFLICTNRTVVSLIKKRFCGDGPAKPFKSRLRHPHIDSNKGINSIDIRCPYVENLTFLLGISFKTSEITQKPMSRDTLRGSGTSSDHGMSRQCGKPTVLERLPKAPVGCWPVPQRLTYDHIIADDAFAAALSAPLTTGLGAFPSRAQGCAYSRIREVRSVHLAFVSTEHSLNLMTKSICGAGVGVKECESIMKAE